MTGDWRYDYVGEDMWRLESEGYSYEDDLIYMIDNPDGEICCTPSGIEMIDQLRDKYKNFLYQYLWEGLTFQQIADSQGYSKPRAHQIYREAINALREIELNKCKIV